MTFLYSHWLALPIQTRHALAAAFGIKKKNPTHVVDDMVKDDGYVIGDIESALSMEAMTEYVGFASPDIWSNVVAKAEGRVNVTAPVTEAQLDAALTELVKEEEASKKKPVTKKKK